MSKKRKEDSYREGYKEGYREGFVDGQVFQKKEQKLIDLSKSKHKIVEGYE